MSIELFHESENQTAINENEVSHVEPSCQLENMASESLEDSWGFDANCFVLGYN